MRETWLIHLCTDWMGDDAWLWRLDCEFRRFNYVGDTHRLRGTVTRKYDAEGGRPAVDVELVAENQRGEVTTPGHATILLPSRDRGPVRLPDPSAAPPISRRPSTPSHTVRRWHGVERTVTASAVRTPPSPACRCADGAVLRLTLDRPDKRNALDDVMVGGLIDAIDVAGRDEQVRAIVLAGAGDHFCGGADIVARNAGGREAPPPRVGSIQRRVPSTAHRLVPLLMAGAGAGRLLRPGLGRRHRLPPGAGQRLHGGRDRRPLLGAVQRAASRPTAPVPGCCPGSPAWCGCGAAAARPPAPRLRGGGLGPDPRRRAVRPPRRRGRGAGGPAGRRSDRGARAHEVLLRSGQTAALDAHMQDEALALELSSRSEDFREGLAAFTERRDPDFRGR